MKRYILVGAVVAVVVVMSAALWGYGIGAQTATPDMTELAHINPDGSDYTGNPYCPDTLWVGGEPTVNPWHDCNNITGQNHAIRTKGWEDAYQAVESWGVENGSGASASILASGHCGTIAEVTGRPDWDTANDDEQCVVIHSSMPGETRVTLTYYEQDLVHVTKPVVKGWDSLVDSVILKRGDLDQVQVSIADDGTEDMCLPRDVNGDDVRHADDEHLLDRQSTWQDHEVVWDEALKRVKSPVPVEITEIVHGEHDILMNAEYITVHHPTEGALVLAEIESDRDCTFFTDATGSIDLGLTLEGVSDKLGRFVVWVDTICEEQAEIRFYAQYPSLSDNVREGLGESIGINWTITPQSTYHITVDVEADGTPGDVQSSRLVSGPFTIEVEVGDAFVIPDGWFQGLFAVAFGLAYPSGLVVPTEGQWNVNDGYLTGWSCSSNSAGGGEAILVCSGWEETAANPTGPGVVASLSFDTIEESCGQGELTLMEDWCHDGCPPLLWGNDWLFEPLTLNNGEIAIPCETPTPTPSPTPTTSPTPTASPTPTPTPTPTPSVLPVVRTPSPTPTPTVPRTASPTLTPEPSPASTIQPTVLPTALPPSPTPSPTPSPAVSPTLVPTPTPYGGAAPGARGPVLPPASGSGGPELGKGLDTGWLLTAAIIVGLAAVCAAASATIKRREQ